MVGRNVGAGGDPAAENPTTGRALLPAGGDGGEDNPPLTANESTPCQDHKLQAVRQDIQFISGSVCLPRPGAIRWDATPLWEALRCA